MDVLHLQYTLHLLNPLVFFILIQKRKKKKKKKVHITVVTPV